MSNIAEFASQLHQKESITIAHALEPIEYPSTDEKLYDIRAIVFDVYGTLINYWKPGLDIKETRSDSLSTAFRKVSDFFGFTEFLLKMEPSASPEKTLSELYHGLIALQHEKLINKGFEFPEVRIDEIWNIILLMLKRHGYNPSSIPNISPEDLPRICAFTYNFYALGRNLYPGIIDTLEKLKENNFVLGILSNAQFYTSIDLNLLLREQSNSKYEDMLDFFDPDLTFYSFEYQVSKPNPLLFRRLFDALYEYQILPSQTVFVGNDLLIDIEPALKVGMKTAFFTGDKQSAFLHNADGKVIPHLTFSDWHDLPSKISFFQKGKQDSL